MWSRRVPAIIVENILWSTLFLVGLFQQLPCVIYFSVPSVCLEGCWKSLLSSIAVSLYCWYNADWQVVLIFFFFSCTGWKQKQTKLNKNNKDIYTNNDISYNYDFNKPRLQTISVSWCSVCIHYGMNEPASGKQNLRLNYHPGNINGGWRLQVGSKEQIVFLVLFLLFILHARGRCDSLSLSLALSHSVLQWRLKHST